MADLKLRVLGDLEVIRGGAVLDLPPSRKTRGLLAYLALTERSMRRERLCELLWEIPDDPRGSLRWSLSKIRKLVDDEQHLRIIADRSNVSFDASDMDIDVRTLHEVVENGLQDMSTPALEQAAEAYQGCFLEGLDLPDFHDFYTWCIGQREHASRSQSLLLRALLQRLLDKPEQALNHATRLVTLLPYDEAARAQLIELLLQLNRKPEAEQQYRMGLQKQQEAGAEDSGVLYRAWRGNLGAKMGGAPNATTVTPQSPTTPRVAVEKTLVGRDRELETLSSMLAELPRAEGHKVVLIRGDPGMGKSSLLRATAALARGFGTGILKASAFESELIRPFGVWNDALRRAMPDNATSALLGSGVRVTRDQVFTSLSDLLSEETAKRPVVVLFDDVQWCDESSAAALHYVLRMNRRQPFLVVAAARETELRDNTAIQQAVRDLRHDNLLLEIRLEPLSAEQLCELISEHAPAVDAARLSQECGGNPLLALELARAEQEGGSGNSLSELVRERMSRLNEDARAVLLWAAVLAPRINLKSLEQVTGLERSRIYTAIEAAEQQGILHPGERGFRFSHDLIARSIYQEISPARQQVMHRRVAELLEEATARDLELAADLAHHAARSGDPALAARAMVSAGKLCLRFYANDNALVLYHRGMEFAAQLGDSDRVCLTLELYDIRLNAAPLEDWEASVAEYIELAEQALDHGALPYARLGYQMASYVRWLHGQWSDAHRDSLQAERVTRSANDEAHILGMAEAAKCLAMLERDLPQADAMAMEASSLAARENILCPALPTSLGILRYYEGRLDAAVDHLEEARTICKAQGDKLNEYLASEYLTIVEVERGDYAMALERCRVLVDMGSRLREGSEYPFALALQAMCRYGLEREESGLDALLQDLRQADAKMRLALLLNRAARLDILHENLDKALARSTEALALAQLMEQPSETLQAHINYVYISFKNKDIDPKTHLHTIEQLTAGTVAGWARERASLLLTKYK
jgi:DNA-binding SARP family transcriptional activator